MFVFSTVRLETPSVLEAVAEIFFLRYTNILSRLTCHLKVETDYISLQKTTLKWENVKKRKKFSRVLNTACGILQLCNK